MSPRYLEAISRAATILYEAMSADFRDLACSGPVLWEVPVREVVRRLASELGQRAVDAIARVVVQRATERGMVIERSPVIDFLSIFGHLKVKSPYLIHPLTKETARPVNHELCIHGGGRSPLAERALTDFGVDASFEKAGLKLNEHYGIGLDRTAILRVVERQGERAIEYIGQRLQTAALAAELDPPASPVAVMVTEMDGSEARTGKLVLISGLTETTPVRQLPKRKRVTMWRDVRVGLVRPLDSEDPSYVASLCSFDAVVGDLAALGAERGAGPSTVWAKVVDGGNGLREALDRQLPGPTILDKCHCRAHLFETARAMGTPEAMLAAEVARWTAILSAGGSPEVIEELAAWRPAAWTMAQEAAFQARTDDSPIKLEDAGMDRVRRLAAHLLRFADAVGYDAFEADGLPIGDGEIESAQRFIPQARLKLPGTWWLPENIDRILALRVIRENGWWDDFWGMNPAPLAEAA
jgi:hypothetical protein